MDSKPPVKSYCGGRANYCTPEVTPEVTGEVTGDVDEMAKVKYMDMSRFPAEIPNWKPGMVVPNPKREWVGLTTSEVIECQEASIYDTYINIEAKLKEKNVPQP